MATNKHISIGRIGEDIAAKYLENRGYQIIQRNYRKKWGEIDIVVEKDDVLHFVEVKAGSCTEPFPEEGNDSYRPEDHMHEKKLARLGRVIQTYLIEQDVSETKDWTIDLAVVWVSRTTRKARIRVIEDILLSE